MSDAIETVDEQIDRMQREGRLTALGAAQLRREHGKDSASLWETRARATTAERDLLAAALARGDRNWPTSADAVIAEARRRIAGGGA